VDGLRINNQPWLAWLFVGLLVVLCAVLGTLQYRWIGEASRAERATLQQGLREGLQRISQEFDGEIARSIAALQAKGGPEDGSDEAYAARYMSWKRAGQHTGLFRRIAVARPQGNALLLRQLDLGTAVFAPADWPLGWTVLRDRLVAILASRPGPGRRLPPDLSGRNPVPLIERPHFGSAPGGEWPRELDWLIVEPDLDYLRTVLLPELVRAHFGEGEDLDYQVELVARDNPDAVLWKSPAGAGVRIGRQADASTSLFDTGFRGPGRPPDPGRGQWLLMVRHRAGSLAAVVEQARLRNLFVTSAVLLLMLAAIGALLQFTRRARRLADLQMNFVAGVGHELRTPLSVIRAAAHNLGGGIISNAEQMQRYGSLIEDQAEKLTAMVEQVLRFSGAEAGRPNYVKETLTAESLVEGAIHSSAKVLGDSGCSVERHVEPGLPPVFGDPVALRHALQNLLANAVKYGASGGWIGISARQSAIRKRPGIEIQVEDRGPGILPQELALIFDPFYRGRKAIDDQIHGTGLGLTLVKRIVEAHGGTVAAHSAPGKGARFVVRLPASRNGAE
jgi:signal transduction histidine kinase